jgi:hypothetical protein
VTLQQGYGAPSAAVALIGGRAGGTHYVGGWGSKGANESVWGGFCNTGGSVELDVKKGGTYTLVVATYAKDLGAFRELDYTVSLTNASTGTPLGCAVTPVGAQTLAGREGAASVEKERARRAAALASMRAAAEASPPGSPQRLHWEDFQAAAAAVEAKRAECRRAGARFNDGWSGTAGAVGAGWKEGAEAVWADMGELCEAPEVVEGGFSLEDVQQGSLGNCYFMACLANLADGAGSELLDAVFVTAEPNPENVYCVRLWVDGVWRWFFMDSRFLCSRGVYREANDDGAGNEGGRPTCWSGEPDPANGRYRHLVSVRSKTPTEMWPSFLEKAWAMLHGSYADTEGDRVDKAPCCAVMSPSFPLNFFVPHSLPGYHIQLESRGAQETQDARWRELVAASAQGFLMTAGARDADALTRLQKNGADSDGIVRHHAFSVLRVLDAGGLPRLVELRNPHGHGEWTGAFSDSDLASWTPALRAATGYAPEQSGDDGVFWMPMSAFVDKFRAVNVTPRITLRNEVPPGPWRKATAAGAFSRAAVEEAKRRQFPENELCFPQFLLKPLAAGPFFISLMQRADRTEARAAPVRRLEFSASLYAFAGADGSEPAQGRDWYYTPPNRPRVSQVAGFASKGLLTFDNVALDPAVGCYILIPEFKALLGTDVGFEVSVASKCPFELRVAAPGVPRASDVGVAWGSGREGAAGGGASKPALPAPGGTIVVANPLTGAGRK